MNLITQSMLAAHELWKQREQHCKEKRIQLRQQIITLLKTQARTEDGMLACHLREMSRRSISQAKVAAILGDKSLEQLLEEIEPHVQEQLRIYTSSQFAKSMANQHHSPDTVS